MKRRFDDAYTRWCAFLSIDELLMWILKASCEDEEGHAKAFIFGNAMNFYAEHDCIDWNESSNEHPQMKAVNGFMQQMKKIQENVNSGT